MKVSVAHCRDYNEVEQALDTCLSHLGGMGNFVKKGDKVLLKINQLFAKRVEHAVTTHPEMVRAAIRLVKKAGGRPFVGDSPAYQSLEHVARKSGILKVCEEEKAHLVPLDKPVTVRGDGKVFRSFRLSGRLKGFDVIINMPKLKTHGLIGFTGAVKNLYGCIPGKIKGSYHLRLQQAEPFAEMLLDLHDVIRSQLNVMDAVIGMEGHGPGAGEPRKIGAIICSENAIALDTVATDMVGLKTREVWTQVAGQKRGIKESSIENIEIVGDRIRIKNFKRAKSMVKFPKVVSRLLKSYFTARPVLNPKKCVSCAGCYHVCPAGAIDFASKKPVFDYAKCIRCYCCHEVCPEKAIFLKSGIFAKMLSKILK